MRCALTILGSMLPRLPPSPSYGAHRGTLPSELRIIAVGWLDALLPMLAFASAIGRTLCEDSRPDEKAIEPTPEAVMSLAPIRGLRRSAWHHNLEANPSQRARLGSAPIQQTRLR